MSSEEPVETSEKDALASESARHGLVRNLRIVSLATLLSRFFGLGRDIAMTTLFGAGTTLDVFIVAFRLPNLTRQLFGEGALTTAFLPVFLREQSQRGDEAARATLTAVAIVLASFLSIIVLLGEALIAWGLFAFTLSDSTRLLLQLLAILLPYMVFICTAALMSAALHALKVFLWPALVPVVLNVVWLTGVAIAYVSAPDEPTQVRIVAVAITVAGVLQMLLPLITLQRLGMGLTVNWRSGFSRVKEILLTMLPVIVGITVIQFNSVLDTLMAWGLSTPDGGGLAPFEAFGIPALLPSGTATGLYIGQRMHQFPLGVFGVALGTVLFPLLTQHAQAGNMNALRADLTKGIRLTIAIALPASAGLFILASPLTNLLFRHGEFTAEDSSLTAQMIAIYGAGVWASIGLTVLNRAFYATGDRISPMRFGVIALTVNLLLNVILVVTFKGIGLAMGSVLATFLQLLLTTWRMNHQLGPLDWSSILSTAWKTLVATSLMLAACYTVLINLSPTHRIASLSLPFIIGVGTFLVVAKVIGMNEISEFFKRGKTDS